MKLTTKGRYAVTAMLDLALHYHGQPVGLAEIGRRQRISLAYLEQLFAKLRKVGLVRSMRGPGGGYFPSCPFSDISVVDVINAVNEPVDSTRCRGSANCQDSQVCLTHDLWVELSDHISDFLSKTSFAELVERHRLRERGQCQEKIVQLVSTERIHHPKQIYER